VVVRIEFHRSERGKKGRDYARIDRIRWQTGTRYCWRRKLHR
jgi:hypothetical protein